MNTEDDFRLGTTTKLHLLLMGTKMKVGSFMHTIHLLWWQLSKNNDEW